MDRDARIAVLREKHRQLERTLDRELRHPQFDQSLVTRLKQGKLRVKDEISRLISRSIHYNLFGCDGIRAGLQIFV